MNSTRQLLTRAGVPDTGLDELVADIEVPVLTGPQRQGDVGIFPRAKLAATQAAVMRDVPRAGVAVVAGEQGRNTHLLLADGPVRFGRQERSTVIGFIDVPDGAVAHLIHEEEHAAISIGPGCYTVRGKREQADEIRRVAD